MKIENARQLKDWIKNLAKKTNVEANILIQNYMLERVLERISLSKYMQNFILKGGMLIGAMVGIDLRTTLDMDATIKGMPLNEDKLLEELNEIMSIELDDDVTFKILNILNIRDEDDYNGYRVTIESTFQTIRQKFKIDITTGDIITPKEIKYKFKLMFENKSIEVFAYNLETVISEKIETIISRGAANTRARDFYDLYIINKLQKANYNEELLHAAILDKFKARGTTENLKNISEKFSQIKESKELRRIWDAYRRDYIYAEDISYEDVIKVTEEFIEIATSH